MSCVVEPLKCKFQLMNWIQAWSVIYTILHLAHAHTDIWAGGEQKRTLYLECYSLTLSCLKDLTLSSFGLAVVRSFVFGRKRSDGLLVLLCPRVLSSAVFVPHILPSSRDINMAAKCHRLFSVHSAMIRTLCQYDFGFFIWGLENVKSVC